MLPVGTRIRFKQDLGCDAAGDHPAFIYAKKGEFITGLGTKEGYWVEWDGWTKVAFGASENEFDVLKTT